MGNIPVRLGRPSQLKSPEMLIVDANNCEFGYELITVVPYVYFLHQKGTKVGVQTFLDMKPFYFFLNDDCFFPNRRETRDTETKVNSESLELMMKIGGHATIINTELKDIHFSQLTAKKWKVPNYLKCYKNKELNTKFKNPLLFVSNKYTKEWGQPPINYLSLDFLKNIFDVYSKKYDLIYSRPLSTNITEDHQSSLDFGDYELVKNYHNVFDINVILQNENYTFNELQLILLSKSINKISVQGGTSIVSSLTGGNNFIFAKQGSELECNSYSWYNRFSGAKVYNYQDENKLLSRIETEIV